MEAADIDLWHNDKNCGAMAGGLEWKDGFSAAKSTAPTKFCIPIIEGGKARAMRLLVPGDAPARKSNKKGAAVATDSSFSHNQLKLAQKVVGFYRKCSAVVHLEQKCTSANGANQVANQNLQVASSAAKEAEKTYEKAQYKVSTLKDLSIPTKAMTYGIKGFQHNVMCKRIEADALSFRQEHFFFLAELASTKVVLASLVSLAKVCLLSPPASLCAATAARPPLCPTLSPPVAFPADNG